MQDSLQKLSTQLDAIARQINRADLTERLRVEEAASRSNSISFGVVGLPRSGKSTVLNALLECEVLPTTMPSQGYTAITIAEAALASVSYANGERKTVSPTPPTLTRASTRPDVSAIEVQYPVSWLTVGTRILEAPGISTQQQDALTYVLAQANILLFVIDARQPISQLERSFLYDLPANITRLIVAATRFDQIAGSDEQDAAYQRISESISALNLKIPVEVFRVAPQIVLTNQYERALLVAWGQFKQAILIQQPAPLEAAPPQPYGVLRVSTLQAVARDLQNALMRFQPEVIPEPSPLSTQQKSDLEETYKLLSRMIADQASDIKQVMEDNFNAFLYQFQDSLNRYPLSMAQIEQRVNTWLEEEKARIETRFQRLYKSILTDAGGALKQKLESGPEKLQFRHVHYTPAQSQSQPIAPLDLLDGMPPEQRLILLGGAAVAVVVGALSGPLGWTLLIAGTGIVGITLYVRRGYRQAGGTYMPGFDRFDIALPAEFGQYIERSARHLQACIDKPFKEVLAAVPVARAASTPTSPALTELQRIQAELALLSD